MSNPCIKYFTWIVASNFTVTPEMCPRWADTGIPRGYAVGDNPSVGTLPTSLITLPCRQAVSWEVPNDQRSVFIHIPPATAGPRWYLQWLVREDQCLASGCPWVIERERQTLELTPELGDHGESFRFCPNSLFIYWKQRHHLNASTHLPLPWSHFVLFCFVLFCFVLFCFQEKF